MQRIIMILILTMVSMFNYGQIIADHTVVDKFDDIPSFYINEVKKMMIAFPGESHSAAYRKGMELLEALYPVYACNVATGEAYTDQYVRVEDWGWTGENVWFTSGASSYLKSEIKTYYTSGHPFHALGFGWCSDMTYGSGTAIADPVFGVHWFGASSGGADGDKAWGLDADDYSITANRVNMTTYFNAMESYITHCASNSPVTRMVFTTGPVDPDGWYTGENGYQGYIKHEVIRNYVKANLTRILFDYADILSYDDNGNLSTQTWNGHTFPSIATINFTPQTIGHISNAGAIRLAKAQWWMLARIAGWDGFITDIKKNELPETLSVEVDYNSEEIRVHTTDAYLSGQISLYTVQGLLIQKKSIENNVFTFNKSALKPGVYIVMVNKSNLKGTKKIVVLP